ncbi:MAG: L-seryl-tRNA(Sec) selenium transferase, partial [Lachnospiraceae bacterium]|nr:L-seryl-tRNA(Sec) selenium transferase [Lachnospiraceae bacterium]
VINATGTILHTNLGRAVLNREDAQRIADLATGYSNLEYNLEAGERGERYSHFEKLLCRLTGAEAAVVVNNNAAAVLLVLSALTAGGEVIVSRGELVEIGGKFRIPDVCALSGANLVETGTTNKTHFSDYEQALSEQTKAVLKVHTSNFSVIGFTESVALSELKPFTEKNSILLIEDIGSGALIDLSKYGLKHSEPTVQNSIESGADIVCFSGDKLLGGPQAGIIIGKKHLIETIKKHPLTRAVRVDKLTVTALELTLLKYLSEEKALAHLPVLKMITQTQDETRTRAENLSALLRDRCKHADISVEDCESQIGGGSLPLERLPSHAVVIRPHLISAASLEEQMRLFETPVIVRTVEDAVRMDVRTMSDDDFESVAGMLATVL